MPCFKAVFGFPIYSSKLYWVLIGSINSRTIQTIVCLGPQIYVISTTCHLGGTALMASFYKLHDRWSYQHECPNSVVQIDHLVVQKNHHLLKPPHVWIQTSHQTLGGFSSWWFFCRTRWSNCTTSLILSSNQTAFTQNHTLAQTNEAAIFNKPMAKMCCLIWTTK